MSIQRRGVALCASLFIVAVVIFGGVSAASGEGYAPLTKSSSSNSSSSNSNSSNSSSNRGSSQSQDPLARTGSSSTIPMVQLAVVLLVAGGFLVIVARKRAQQRVTSTS